MAKNEFTTRNNKPEYHSWMNMVQRCTNPNSAKYRHYGKRGISVCLRWRVFANFIADMGRKPTPKHSIERINNDGNYEPTNCKWATQREQTRNFSRNHWLTFNGQTLCLKDWAIKLGINSAALIKRLRLWPLERALTEPANKHHRTRSAF